VFEGMWWKQGKNVTGFVSLSNTSARPIAAALQLSDQQGIPLTNHNVTISSHGTKIVNLQELQSITPSEGGIRIAYQGPQGALLATGGLEDPSVGYSAGLHFVPKEAASKAVSIRVAELGLMVGAADPDDVISRRNQVHSLFVSTNWQLAWLEGDEMAKRPLNPHTIIFI
jgi:hypothetical protein